MQIEINNEFISHIRELIQEGNHKEIKEKLANLHYADIAEVLEELSSDEAVYVLKRLDKNVTSDILADLDEDTREKVLKLLSAKEIAQEIDSLESDDAADIINELTDEQKNEVISNISDIEHAKDIVDLLRYDEDTAGGLMGKELIKVYENWTTLHCVKEMRKQAASIDRVHTIYVVDDNDILKGRLSLKSLLTTSTKTPIKEIYNPNINSVIADESAEDVAKIMQKYDLFVLPVTDEMQRLIGQITIDDVVDVIRDEADKDYQMAAGITDDVEADDNIVQLTKARLPWLVLGLFGGIGAAYIMGGFENALEQHKMLFYFTPLIAAMAGNVGVQSSAIIVQGLANNNIKGSLIKRLFKEIGLSLINGLVLALLVLAYGLVQQFDFQVNLVIASALIIVIIIAALIGTFVPIVLDKNGIDPALATGPFITTSNDIFGILIYFLLAEWLLGF